MPDTPRRRWDDLEAELERRATAAAQKPLKRGDETSAREAVHKTLAWRTLRLELTQHGRWSRALLQDAAQMLGTSHTALMEELERVNPAVWMLVA